MAKNKKQNKQAQLSPQKYIQTRGRFLPIEECVINIDWEETGLATIIVSRKHQSGNLTVGGFLVDTFCLGVKKAYYKFNIPEKEYIRMKEIFKGTKVVEVVPYDLVHNIIYGGIEFAEEFGISPCSDFTIVKYLLEEDTEAIPLIEFNFGVDGEPMLIAKSREELNKFLPILKRTVPDIKFQVADDNFSVEDEDEEYEEEETDWEDALDSLVNAIGDEDAVMKLTTRMERMKNELLKSKELHHSIYQYQYPEYPKHIHLNNPLLNELVDSNNNISIAMSLIQDILLCERETLIQDLENIILYEIGRTYPVINKEEQFDVYNDTLIHAVLFLAELRSTQSLNVVLEILRQNFKFITYHYGDLFYEILPPAIFKLGGNQLPALTDFMKEPGLEPSNKVCVLRAVSAIGVLYPERRDEAIQWFRDLMKFFSDNLDNNLIYDAGLCGTLMSCLIELKAKELLPEVEEMFSTGQVGTLLAGDCEKVKSRILDSQEPFIHLKDLNIYDWYKSFEF